MRNFLQALASKEYWLLLGVSCAGYFDASRWVIVPAAILLTFFSVVSDPHYVRQFAAIGKLHVLGGLWLVCLVQNFLFIGLSFAMGMAVRWLFGSTP